MGDKTSVRHSCAEAPTPYENNYQLSAIFSYFTVKPESAFYWNKRPAFLPHNRQQNCPLQNPDNEETNFTLLLPLGFHWPLPETTAVDAQRMCELTNAFTPAEATQLHLVLALHNDWTLIYLIDVWFYGARRKKKLRSHIAELVFLPQKILFSSS